MFYLSVGWSLIVEVSEEVSGARGSCVAHRKGLLKEDEGSDVCTNLTI